jgi:thiamine-phosphate pyrophosphorylase
MIAMPARGLYALTPQWYPDRRRLLDAVRSALDGGAALIQFRDKSGDGPWRLETAVRLRSVCADYRVPLVINDDLALAGACGAAGVHLGREDASVAVARQALGGRAIIGVSCYNRFDRAQAAAAAGAGYLAFGSMYPSSTKPDAARCETGLLRKARALGLPLVAIGGITKENGPPVIRGGADFLAVISGVFDQADIARAARGFAALWEDKQ